MEYGSRQVKWYWLIVFIAFCGFTVYRLFLGNPFLYSHIELRQMLTKGAERKRQTIPEHPSSPAKLGAQTYIPRYNLERNAVDPSGQPRSRSYLETSIHPIDFGIENFEPLHIAGDAQGFYLAGKSTWVIATDLEGQVRWRYKFTENGTPYVLVDTDSAYLIHSNGEIVCVVKTTGELRWLIDLHADVVAAPFFWNKNLMVPLKNGERVQLATIHRADGGLELPAPKLDIKPEFALAFGTNLEAFIATVGNKVIAIDPEDWDILWTQTLTDPIKGPAVINDQQIFVATMGAKIVRLDGAKKGKIDWELDLPKNPLSPPAVLPIMQKLSVLDAGGALSAIEIKSGKLLWREPIDNRNPLNETWSARLKGRNIEEFKMDWSHKGWAIWAPCADRHICIYTPGKGQLIERIALGGQPILLPLSVDHGYAILVQTKAGHFAISRLIEESEAKKNKSAQ